MTITSPPYCANSAITISPEDNKIVLLNNNNYPGRSVYTNITWTWDGSDWSTPTTSAIDSSGPLPGRKGTSMVYDGATIMLFGGESTISLLNDTWSYNGSTWTLLTPATSPSARSHMSMGCSHSNSKCVMFGGKNHYNTLGDTWTWNGSTWAQQNLNTTPSARYSSCLMAGATHSILFAGANGSVEFNDTWDWDGDNSTWTLLTPTHSPSARHSHAGVFDRSNLEYVIFGGANNQNILNDTWVYNPSTSDWSQKSPAYVPPARKNAHMAWDPVNEVVMMFGGQNGTTVYNDTWAWTGTNWVTMESIPA